MAEWGSGREAAAAILAQRRQLAERAAGGASSLPAGSVDEWAQILRYLAESALHDAPDLFREYTGWLRDVRAAQGSARVEVSEQLEVLRELLRGELGMPADAPPMRCLAAGLEAAAGGGEETATGLAGGTRTAELARAYLDALLAMRGEAGPRPGGGGRGRRALDPGAVSGGLPAGAAGGGPPPSWRWRSSTRVCSGAPPVARAWSRRGWRAISTRWASGW